MAEANIIKIVMKEIQKGLCSVVNLKLRIKSIYN